MVNNSRRMILMDQIFIKVRNKKGKIINKDILDCTKEERLEWHNAATKLEISLVVEMLIKSTLR